MKFGFLSGMTWGLNAVVIAIVWSMSPYANSAESSVVIPFLGDFISAILLFALMSWRRRLNDTFAAIKTKAGLGVALAAVFGGPVAMTGYVFAIGSIGPAYTAIITAFFPAVGSLLAYIFLKERMKFGQIIALIVALTGVALVSWVASEGGENTLALVGLLAALLSVLGWASEAVILAWAMRNETVDNETALHIRQTTSAVVYAILVLPLFGAVQFATNALLTTSTLVISVAAVVGTVSYLYYYRSILVIGAARSMALNIAYAAWTVFFSAIFLQQIPSPLAVVCCIVILIGTTLAATPDWSSFSQWKQKKQKTFTGS